jgi:hypothetical protein
MSLPSKKQKRRAHTNPTRKSEQNETNPVNKVSTVSTRLKKIRRVMPKIRIKKKYRKITHFIPKNTIITQIDRVLGENIITLPVCLRVK